MTNTTIRKKILLGVTFTLAIGFSLSDTRAAGWSGTTVDIRTGQPLASVRLFGGARGRVDLTEAAVTGANGAFTVTYDQPLDLNVWGYYMLTATHESTPSLYFRYSRIGPSALGDVRAKMVPRHAYLRGVVKDKATGQPLAGARVDLGVPGAYWEHVQTDAQGGFQFHTGAYDGTENYEEGIPPAEQYPHEAWQQARPKTNYWLEVTAPGYRTMRTSNLPLQINLVSSTTPDLHTFVTLEVVAATDTVNAPAATTAVQNPFTDAVNLAVARAIKVFFTTRAGVEYQLQRGDTALGPWQNVGAPFTGDGAAVSQYLDAEPAQAGFYRAQVISP